MAGRLGGLIVRPIKRAEARKMCEDHPHAGTLPNSSRFYMRADLDGRPVGLAVWGHGITPKATADKLFRPGTIGTENYLELCRFFVYDFAPKNTPSRFLAITHRLIAKHAPNVKLLYTYAAGFQGLTGGIYQAAGYDYIGTQEVNAFLHVPEIGLVHRIALHHRYGRGTTLAKHWQEIYPGSTQWCGLNFRYIYWTCSPDEKKRLLQAANFTVQPNPKASDLRIWTVDHLGQKRPIDPEFAKTIPIIKLKTSRAESIGSDAARVHRAEDGAAPISALHKPVLLDANDGLDYSHPALWGRTAFTLDP